MKKSLSIFAVSACLVAFVPTCGGIQERASSASATSDLEDADAGATVSKTKHDTVKNSIGNVR